MNLKSFALSSFLHLSFFLGLLPWVSSHLTPGKVSHKTARGGQISVSLISASKQKAKKQKFNPAISKQGRQKKETALKVKKKESNASKRAQKQNNDQQKKDHTKWGPHLDALGGWGSTIGGQYYHPRYPKLSRIYQEEGRVKIGIKVVSGEITKIKIVDSSGHKRLDNASLKAVGKWQFPEGFSKQFVQMISFKID